MKKTIKISSGSIHKGFLCRLGFHKWRMVYKETVSPIEYMPLLSEHIKYFLKNGEHPKNKEAVVYECARMKDNHAIIGCWTKIKQII